MSILFEKLKEVSMAVIPITLIVVILHFTIAPLETVLLLRFLLGAVMIIIGLSIFLCGVDLGITPLGNQMGDTITKSNKLLFVVLAGLFLGFFINVAEPDLRILADQVGVVSSGSIPSLAILLTVSVGIGIMLALGLIRIVFNVPLYKMLTVIYGMILILSFFTTSEFLAISFDASGATTGALTVPFFLALAIGVSSLKKNGKASEKDSFGLVGIASTGAILSVLIMSIFYRTDEITASLELTLDESSSLLAPFAHYFPEKALESLVALLPLVAIFFLFQIVSFKLSRKAFRKIMKGMAYTFVGLVLFLTGVSAGFMDVGNVVGHTLASMDNKAFIILIGFVLGLVTILAEPAVYVLTEQIENVTSGYVKKKQILFTLSIGVGVAVALSMIRIVVPGVQLWHYLLPGFIISIMLTYITPKLFVGIAFDSGGVASGPMTATFILAFAQGAAESIEGANVLIDGFGVIAMVAMTPLIALQILGLIYKMKSGKGGLETNG